MEIDSYFQNDPDEQFQKRWDRNISQYFPRENTGNGWEDVKKNYPGLFYKAWGECISTMENRGVTKEMIENQ